MLTFVYGRSRYFPEFQGNESWQLFEYFWFSVFIFSSIISFAWDVCVDWGLGRVKDDDRDAPSAFERDDACFLNRKRM